MCKKFFNNTWESVEILGKGTYGTVYKAKKIDDDIELYSAIKEIRIPNNLENISSLRTEGMTIQNIDEELYTHVNNIKKEIKTLNKFKDTTNIVNIEDYEVKEIKEDSICSKTYKINIRMELLKSIDKLFLYDDLKDKEVLKIGIDIASALEALESEKFIHRDIKPENIFVNSNGTYKLGDFGEAKELNKSISNVSIRGTEHYMAPELLSGKKVDKTVDIYSLGIVLYRFFNNKKFPFYPTDGTSITAKIREEARFKRYSGEKLPKPVNANYEVANIILKMCAYKKEDRYQSSSDLKNDLIKALNNIKKEKNVFIENTKIIDDDYKTISLYAQKKKLEAEKKKKEELKKAEDMLSTNIDNSNKEDNNDTLQKEILESTEVSNKNSDEQLYQKNEKLLKRREDNKNNNNIELERIFDVIEPLTIFIILTIILLIFIFGETGKTKERYISDTISVVITNFIVSFITYYIYIKSKINIKIAFIIGIVLLFIFGALITQITDYFVFGN